ncbi:MAG: glycosyltransferase family 2 protein [Microthrixaceae bacterium]
MNKPDLTVVLSTHNRPVEMRQALAAIVGQDYDGPIETIIVWDKTTPEHELSSIDPHRPVQTISNDHTPGLPGGRNSGVAKASAPVVAFCDDDDIWDPTKARKQLALLERTGAPAVGCSTTIVTPEREIVRRATASAIRFEDLLLARVPEACMGCAMVRREAFEGPIGGMDEHIPGGYGEDYEWWLRAARHAPIPNVEEGLYRVLWTGSSFFRQGWQNMDESLAMLMERFPEFKTQPKGLGRILGQRAFANAAMGNRAEALSLSVSALRYKPTEARVLLAMAVAAGIEAERVMALANRFGRGI